MYNHFRTVLLNLSYNGDDSEYIPETFSSINLLPKYAKVHGVLFPSTATRWYKCFLVDNYLRLIQSTGYGYTITGLDPRISYDQDNKYFHIHRISNPIISNSLFPIFIQGSYGYNAKLGGPSDTFKVRQIDDTNKITIYSTLRKKYLKDNSTFDSPVSDAEIALTFSPSGASNNVLVGNTGLSFFIAAGATFSDTSSKRWEFGTESPIPFNFNEVFTHLNTSGYASGVIQTKSSIDTSTFDQLWTAHYNPVFRFSGFLISYVYKLSEEAGLIDG